MNVGGGRAVQATGTPSSLFSPLAEPPATNLEVRGQRTHPLQRERHGDTARQLLDRLGIGLEPPAADAMDGLARRAPHHPGCSGPNEVGLALTALDTPSHFDRKRTGLQGRRPEVGQ